MRERLAFTTLLGLGSLLLTSCAWVRDGVIDQVAGFPASQVISDVKSTSDEYEQEKHEERAEELSREYEEFLRSRDTVGTEQKATEQSVVIKQEKK